MLRGTDDDNSERERLKNLSVDGEIMLKWVFKKYDESVVWIGMT